jgi:ribonuclease HI
MIMPQPHFLLFCDTHIADGQSNPERAQRLFSTGGRWHFVLERLDGAERLEVADSESAVNRERLALLSVVRGLEALEQPSRVTLVTTSRYVSRGLRYGLSSWREADYKWERFGEQRPVRNADLWRRVDVALGYHAVNCRLIQSTSAAQAIAPAADLNARPAIAAEPVPGLVGAEAGAKCTRATAETTKDVAKTFGRDSVVNSPIAAAYLPQGNPKGSSLETDRRKASLWPLFMPKSLVWAWMKWWRSHVQWLPAVYGA